MVLGEPLYGSGSIRIVPRSPSLRAALVLLRSGDLRTIVRKGWRRLHSESVFIGLRRDLSVPFSAPEALISLTIRPLQAGDVDQLLNDDDPGMPGAERLEIASRRQLVAEEIPTCLVAVTADDVPCYMQWLIGPQHNARVQEVSNGFFPVLAADEALLEAAFTPAPFRGKRIMSAAMARIAERGRQIGARWVITFVEHDNVASLKGCERAGFTPYLTQRVSRRLFRRRLTREPVPEPAPMPA